MTWMGKKNTLKHLGTLHGKGTLAPAAGGDAYGPVSYEIDGYLEREVRTGTGEIEGDAGMLARAFAAEGGLVLQLEKGGQLAIKLDDPAGEAVASVTVPADFPA